MNTLRRDIRVGEIVVVSPAFFGDHVALPANMRAFVCLDGGGMSCHSAATQINGYWYSPPANEDIIEGICIDQEETLQYRLVQDPMMAMA